MRPRYPEHQLYVVECATKTTRAEGNFFIYKGTFGPANERMCEQFMGFGFGHRKVPVGTVEELLLQIGYKEPETARQREMLQAHIEKLQGLLAEDSEDVESSELPPEEQVEVAPAQSEAEQSEAEQSEAEQSEAEEPEVTKGPVEFTEEDLAAVEVPEDFEPGLDYNEQRSLLAGEDVSLPNQKKNTVLKAYYLLTQQ